MSKMFQIRHQYRRQKLAIVKKKVFMEGSNVLVIHFLNNNPKKVTQPTTWFSPLAYLYFDIFVFVF